MDVSRLRGHLFLGHGGDLLGFNAMAAWYPDARLALLVMINSSSAGAQRLATDIVGNGAPFGALALNENDGVSLRVPFVGRRPPCDAGATRR
jgi:hypothetical protein